MKCKQIFLTLMLLLFSAFTLLSGVACTEPDAPPAAPQGEPPALEGWKHQVTNITAATVDSFLSVPDTVAYISDRFERVEVIPAEQQSAVCAAFAAFRRDPTRLDGFLLCGAVSQSDIADKMSELGGYAIEYRYDQRRRYGGELILEDTGTNILTEAVEYDAVLWFPVKGTFLLYRDGQYFGIQDGWYTFEVLTPLYARLEQALATVVKGFTIRYPEYDGDYAFHNASNTQPIESATLLARPDAVALVEGYPYIKSFSDESSDALWSAFSALSLERVTEGSAQLGAGYALPPDDVELRLPYIATYGIEFRYAQRRVLTGTLLTDGGALAVTAPIEYDAVLWLLDFDGNLSFLLYKDGEYFGINGRWYVFEITDDASAALKAQLGSEVAKLKNNPYD